MPKKSINLSLAAIAKVEARAEVENRNFSNMLETIINESEQGKHIKLSEETTELLTKSMRDNG